MVKVKHSSPMTFGKFQQLICRGRWRVKRGRTDREEYDVYVAIFWARERDNYTCQKCGRSDVPVEGHHIKPQRSYPQGIADVDNIISYCRSCHAKEHGR